MRDIVQPIRAMRLDFARSDQRLLRCNRSCLPRVSARTFCRRRSRPCSIRPTTHITSQSLIRWMRSSPKASFPTRMRGNGWSTTCRCLIARTHNLTRPTTFAGGRIANTSSKRRHGFVVTEFLAPVRHAGPYNTISCAFGHHLAEGSWLRDRRLLDEYTRFWFRSGEDGGPAPHFHKFSSWAAAAIRDRYLVTRRPRFRR